ncbi:GNAT family N-acetyltransferase [Kitasatospora purpeofusca]|uniref:GNAT family N-acetyltransferase n=1 Tax=Kitasatospora purpeofusca TaxID=67352 RepID=A0ABZ1U575_9ACTN|nr:GNAT family N-acetyltransferase [Kitasatospora purpeofusca]
MSPTALRTEVRPVAEVAPDLWTGFGPGVPFYAGHRWLTCAAEATGEEVLAVTVGDGRRLLAAVPAWVTTGRENPFLQPERLLPTADPAGRPYLCVATKKAYTSPLLTAPGADRPEVLARLLDGVRRVVRERDLAGAVALYADTATVRRWHPVLADRHPVLLDVDASVERLPAEFAGHPLAVASKRRREVQREWRVFEGAGYRLGVEHLADCLDEFVPLAANLERKHGNPVDEDGLRHTLEVQARHCRDDDLVFTARRDGRLVVACLAYTDRDTVYSRMFAMDYEAAGQAFEYFGLAYYLPVRHAVEHGFRRVNLGMSTVAAKIARGAEVRPLWALDLGERPLWTPDRARAANADRRAALDPRAGAPETADTDPRWPW